MAWSLSLYYLFGQHAVLGWSNRALPGVPPLTIVGYSLADPRVLGVLILGRAAGVDVADEQPARFA